jgi:magnesium chelatase family protein
MSVHARFLPRIISPLRFALPVVRNGLGYCSPLASLGENKEFETDALRALLNWRNGCGVRTTARCIEGPSSGVSSTRLPYRRGGTPSITQRNQKNAVLTHHTEFATMFLAHFKGTKVHCNVHMTSRQIRKFCEPDAGGHRLPEVVTEKVGFSARASTSILKVARTIAKLEGTEAIGEQHIAEAIQYRRLDRKTLRRTPLPAGCHHSSLLFFLRTFKFVHYACVSSIKSA